jgi:hypothetical protein
VNEEPQIGLEDEVIDDADILGALEEREEARRLKLHWQKQFAKFDEKAKAMIPRKPLEEGKTLRIGRFSITGKDVQGGHEVSGYTTRDRFQVSIKAESTD